MFPSFVLILPVLDEIAPVFVLICPELVEIAPVFVLICPELVEISDELSFIFDKLDAILFLFISDFELVSL